MMKWAYCLALFISLACPLSFAQEETPAESEQPATDTPSAEPKKDAAKDEPQAPVKVKPMYDNNKPKVLGSPVEYKPRKPKVKAQEAIVSTDGATMYKRPNFDSQVMGYLNARQKVKASNKIYHGEGGFGAFYKIAVNKKVGYVADTDLLFQNKGSTNLVKKKMDSKPEAMQDDNEMEKDEKDPIYFTRYFGITTGYVDFAEKYAGRTYSSKEILFGLKFTGPDILFDSAPPMDINLVFHSGAPKLFNKMGANGASGYFAMLDAVLLLPFNEWGNWLIDYGLGAVFVYTDFKVPVNGQTLDSSDKRIGLVLDLGGAYRFSHYTARVNMKYYYEKTQYLGYWAGIEMQY